MSTEMLCENCHEVIALIDLEKMTLPLTPDQFKTVRPGQTFDPFPPSATFRTFWCPICDRQPIFEEDRVAILKDGRKVIVQIGQSFRCDTCGQTYLHKSSLVRHKKEQHG